MRQRNCNCCKIAEEGLAWLIGWFDGLIFGCIYSCYEHVDDDDVDEMIKGAKIGFKEGTWVGHLDK